MSVPESPSVAFVFVAQVPQPARIGLSGRFMADKDICPTSIANFGTDTN